jgi:lipoprotein-anchoring transpeptidase ErfK/SrfK
MQLGGATVRPVVYQQRPMAIQRRGLFAPRTVRPTPTQAAQPVSAINPGIPVVRHGIEQQYMPQMVDYDTKEKPGTIVIDTNNRFLYLVMQGGKARRYGVGVGKPGFEWAGEHKITRKAEWPNWTPPREMVSREAAKGHYLPARMDGGPDNPLGARAMYLGSSLYRIHGTNAPWTIGSAVSSGCIRLRNEDIADLYERVNVGTRVIVM